jgi:hypothetical protein
MPWWMKIYVAIFIIIVISNIIFQLKLKVKKLIMIYEFVSASYMIYLIYVFWSPYMIQTINIFNIAALIIVIIIDFSLTIWGTEKELGLKVTEMS